jgi:hypothetical protein
MDEIIQIINNVPYSPPQAELADKGKTPLRPKLIVATTNVKNLSANAYYQSELAIRRRLPYVITPTVREEFAMEVDFSIPAPYDRVLDSSKTKSNIGNIPNYWDFRVEKVQARPSVQENIPQGAQLRLVHEQLNIFQLLQYIGQESRKHVANQKLVKESKKALIAMTICNVCLLPSEMCTCEIQSVEEAEIILPPYTWGWQMSFFFGALISFWLLPVIFLAFFNTILKVNNISWIDVLCGKLAIYCRSFLRKSINWYISQKVKPIKQFFFQYL